MSLDPDQGGSNLSTDQRAVVPSHDIQNKTYTQAQRDYANAVKSFNSGKAVEGKNLLLRSITSTDSLLKEDLGEDQTIRIRLFRARSYELLAKISPALSNTDKILSQGLGADKEKLKKELTNVEGNIGSYYLKARAEVLAAKNIASTDQQKKGLDSVNRELFRAEARSKHALYKFVVDTEVQYADQGLKKAAEAQGKLESEASRLQNEKDARTWYERLFDREAAKRDSEIGNAKGSAAVIREGTGSIVPTIQKLKQIQAQAELLNKQGRTNESLNLLKYAVAHSMDIAIPQHAETALRISKIARPVLLDTGTSLVTAGTTGAVAASGFGLPASVPAGILAGTATRTIGGALWNAVEKEVEITLGKKTRKQAYAEYRKEAGTNAINDAQAGAITSTATVVGGGVGSAVLKVAGGGTTATKVIAGATGGAASGATSSTLSVSIEVAKATTEFLKDPQLNVSDSKQRMENYQKFLNDKGLSFDQAAKDFLIATISGGAGGAVGARAEVARGAAGTAAGRVGATIAEGAANIGIGAAAATVQSGGALTSDDEYSAVTGAVVGGVVGHRAGRKTPPKPIPAADVSVKLMRPIEHTLMELVPFENYIVGRQGHLIRNRSVNDMHVTVRNNGDGNYLVTDISNNGTYFQNDKGEWVKLNPGQGTKLPAGTKLRMAGGESPGYVFSLPERLSYKGREYGALGVRWNQNKLSDEFIVETTEKRRASLVESSGVKLNFYGDSTSLKNFRDAVSGMGDKFSGREFRSIHVVDSIGYMKIGDDSTLTPIRMLPPDFQGRIIVTREALNDPTSAKQLLNALSERLKWCTEAKNAKFNVTINISNDMPLFDDANFEKPSLASPGGKYKGWRLIHRDSPIMESVSAYAFDNDSDFTKGVLPIIVTRADPILSSAYLGLLTRVQRGMTESELLHLVHAFTKEKMPYYHPAGDVDNQFAKHYERSTGTEYTGGTVVSLGMFLQAKDNSGRQGLGVCRHQALLAAYFVERLVQDGILSGTTSLERSSSSILSSEGESHAWLRFTSSKTGTVSIIDPAATNSGELEKTNHWPYLRHSDISEIQRRPL